MLQVVMLLIERSDLKSPAKSPVEGIFYFINRDQPWYTRNVIRRSF